MAFMDADFLLDSAIAKELYHGTAEKLPIIDYNSRVSVKDICDDLRYENITQAWLETDEYKLRLMRSAGLDEEFITGSADAHAKFLKWAEVLGMAAGNPLYHWSHLELRRFFNYNGLLNIDTAEDVWELCNNKLKDADFSICNLIKRSNVEVICTAEDPTENLECYKELDNNFKILPVWRPDKAMDIEKPGWHDYLVQLEKASGMNINSFKELKSALKLRMDYFAEHGCSVSDHALSCDVYAPAYDDEIENIFSAGISGQIPDDAALNKFKTAFMAFAAREYKKRGWAMQIHYDYTCGNSAKFLNSLERLGDLPKTILYNLDANHNAAIDIICGSFGVNKVQHGAACYFNDNLDGILNHLKSLANLGCLADSIGMTANSKSFFNCYSRHEYFRRILCRFLGELVTKGLYPNDLNALNKIVSDISYNNAKKFFDFK